MAHSATLPKAFPRVQTVPDCSTFLGGGTHTPRGRLHGIGIGVILVDIGNVIGELGFRRQCQSRHGHGSAVHCFLRFALMPRAVLCCAMLCCVILGCAVPVDLGEGLIDVNTMLARVESSCTDLTGTARTTAPALVYPT